METVMTSLNHQHMLYHLLMLGLCRGPVILDTHVYIVAEILYRWLSSYILKGSVRFKIVSTCQIGPWWWISRGSSAPCRTGSYPHTHHTWTSLGRGRGRPSWRPPGPRSVWRGSPWWEVTWTVGWSGGWDLLRSRSSFLWPATALLQHNSSALLWHRVTAVVGREGCVNVILLPRLCVVASAFIHRNNNKATGKWDGPLSPVITI